jgi:hypothetical protein
LILAIKTKLAHYIEIWALRPDPRRDQKGRSHEN